ncbi:MAG: hypothetical protein Q9212_005988, partial [Teloschistes hypoglaucus]
MDTVSREVRIVGDAVGSLKAKVNVIDSRISVLGNKVESVQDRMRERFSGAWTDSNLQFHLLQNITRNRLCTQGWEKIYPVAILDRPGRKDPPAGFPDTVGDFWALKEHRNFSKLLSLLEAYGIEGSGWMEPGDQKHIQEDMIHPERMSDIRKALMLHPDKAHRALALELGLDYDRIAATFAQHENMPPVRVKEESSVPRQSVHTSANGTAQRTQPSVKRVTRVRNAVLASGARPFLVHLKVQHVVVTASAIPVLFAAKDNAVVRSKAINVVKVVEILVPRTRNAVGMMMEGFSDDIFENMCKGLVKKNKASTSISDEPLGIESTSTIEGGAGAQIGCVPEEQNDWQGTYWSSWLAEARASGILKPGGKFRVKLGSFDCGTFIGKRNLFKRASPVLSSGDRMAVLASTAFGNLSNGANAVIVPLTPDPEFGYPGKYTAEYSLTGGALSSAYILDDSGEPFETLPSLQPNTSNTTTFTIDDEGAGNIWLLGWTRSENPKLNVSVKAPPAPASTSFTSAASSTGSGSVAEPTKGAISGAETLGVGM